MRQARPNLRCEQEREDGSYLSTLYPARERRHPSKGIRVIEYTLKGMAVPEDPEGEPTFRLITALLGPKAAPAVERAALYPDRWEIESVFDALRTPLRGRQMLLRRRTPDLIRQEFYGLMMAHYAIRGLMHEAALKAEVDPDRLSLSCGGDHIRSATGGEEEAGGGRVQARICPAGARASSKASRTKRDSSS